jgi:hypothetical protein
MNTHNTTIHMYEKNNGGITKYNNIHVSVSHTIKYKCKAAPVLFKHTSRIKTNLYFAFKIPPLFLSYMYIGITKYNNIYV